MLRFRNLAEVFIRALAVGIAEQRARGVYGQYTSCPQQRVKGHAIKRSRTSNRYRGHNGAREMERRRRQYAAGQLNFHSYGR